MFQNLKFRLIVIENRFGNNIIKIIMIKHNIEWPQANNSAMREARDELIAFLCNDLKYLGLTNLVRGYSIGKSSDPELFEKENCRLDRLGMKRLTT